MAWLVLMYYNYSHFFFYTRCFYVFQRDYRIRTDDVTELVGLFTTKNQFCQILDLAEFSHAVRTINLNEKVSLNPVWCDSDHFGA